MIPSLTPRHRLSAQERRKQILQQAFQLISKQGFKTVSVRDIARAAQINEALIYRYFPTKNCLLRAIVVDAIEQQPIQPQALPETREEFRSQLQRFVEFFLEKNGQDGVMVRIIVYAIMENFSMPDEFNFNKEGSFLYWFARSIERGKQQWGFNPQADLGVAISLFMGGLIFFVLQLSLSDMAAGKDVAPFRRTFVDFYLKSLEACGD